VSRRGHEGQKTRGDLPVLAATAEEAEVAMTRLFAEWELRQRLVQKPGSLEALAAQEQVVQQLAALGPAALEPLMRVLRSPAASSAGAGRPPAPAAGSQVLGRAAAAALALGRMGDVRAAPALLAALRDQRGGMAPVRAAAATALGALKAEAAATLYEQALTRQSEDDWQAETARLGALRLETVVEALVEALRDPVPEVRAAAADACIDLCLAEPPQGLLEAGRPAPVGAKERPAAAPALALAVGPLCGALKDEDAAVRVSAATALGWIGDPRALAPLVRCLKDEDERCRAAAALALGMLRSLAALRPLARALGDASAVVRQQVAESLGLLGDPIAADLLLDVLADEEETLEVWAAAARALGHLHLPQALPVLRALLEAPEPALRMAAVEALGRLGFGRAYRWLVPLLWRESDRAVRYAAARAVAQLAPARQSRARWRLRLALRVALQVRQEALAILEEHGRAAHQALRE
jgi:HEAT repeat protein